jgi:hypothetical protein
MRGRPTIPREDAHLVGYGAFWFVFLAVGVTAGLVVGSGLIGAATGLIAALGAAMLAARLARAS